MVDDDLRLQAIELKAERGIACPDQLVALQIRRETETPTAELQIEGELQKDEVVEIRRVADGQIGDAARIEIVGVAERRRKGEAETPVVVEVPGRPGHADRGRSRVLRVGFRALADCDE